MNYDMDIWWEWPILTRRCPGCGVTVDEDALQGHSAQHWLDDDLPKEDS